MKKKFAIITITLIIFLSSLFTINKVYADTTKSDVINNKTESTLVELKEKELKQLEDYEEAYGSKSYGITAYALHKIQVYSIPFCFIGIILGAVYQYVLGVRHIETKEKGLALMISFVTIAVICQVLPLVFTIVVKFGRE